MSAMHVNATSVPFSLPSSAYKYLVKAQQYLWAPYGLTVQ